MDATRPSREAAKWGRVSSEPGVVSTHEATPRLISALLLVLALAPQVAASDPSACIGAGVGDAGACAGGSTVGDPTCATTTFGMGTDGANASAANTNASAFGARRCSTDPSAPGISGRAVGAAVSSPDVLAGAYWRSHGQPGDPGAGCELGGYAFVHGAGVGVGRPCPAPPPDIAWGSLLP